MSSAGNYLLRLVPSGVQYKTFFETHPISSIEESDLLKFAQEDAHRYTYNALISFLGGIAGLHIQQTAWAITKMYYTAFYAGRAALCNSQYVIFHVPKGAGDSHTQYEIQIKTGQRANIVDKPPSTHKLVAHRFRNGRYPRFMQSLKIDGTDPVLWLMYQREYWQYRAERFSDPDFPDILSKFNPDRTQRLLAEYSADSNGVFLADPEHATIAIPFRLVEWLLSSHSLLCPGVIDEEDINYLRKQCRIGKQKLNSIDRYLLK